MGQQPQKISIAATKKFLIDSDTQPKTPEEPPDTLQDTRCSLQLSSLRLNAECLSLRYRTAIQSTHILLSPGACTNFYSRDTDSISTRVHSPHFLVPFLYSDLPVRLDTFTEGRRGSQKACLHESHGRILKSDSADNKRTSIR